MFQAETAFLGLLLVFHKENFMNDRNAVRDRDVEQGLGHRLGNQGRVACFTLENHAEGENGVEAFQVRCGLDEYGNLEGTRGAEDLDMRTGLECGEFARGVVHEGLDKGVVKLAGHDRIREGGVCCCSRPKRKGFRHGGDVHDFRFFLQQQHRA